MLAHHRRHRRRVRFVLLVLVAGITLAVATSSRSASFEDTIAQRMKACETCHGPAGAGLPSTLFPRLAGQPADYLAAQLRAFRDGRRTYPPMNFLMTRQSDAYIAEMAEYFAKQKPDPAVVVARRKAPVDAAVVEAGRKLVHEGRPADGVPACVSCHGADLMGMTPMIPALAGLPRDLMVEQIGAWKAGVHRSPEPNCMSAIAKRLSGEDIAAAATWLSLQLPEGGPSTLTGPLPLACGGIDHRAP